MSLSTLERPTQPEDYAFGIEQGLADITDLPRSADVCETVLKYLEPLRSDEACRSQFYGDMQIARTELQRGSDVARQEVLYKDERLQPGESYKSRGASYRVMLAEEDGVVAFSTGNHARAVGIAAKLAGKTAAVYGTDSMSRRKVELVEDSGAELIQVKTFQLAEISARAHARNKGLALITPFSDPEVLAGQCTLGDEIVEDLERTGMAHSTVIIAVSVAGGGHITGVAIPIWEAKQSGRLGPNVQVIGVQPEGTNTMGRALNKLRDGQEPVGLYAYDRQDKGCDALAIGETSLNPATMAIVADPGMVSGFYTVSQADIGRAMAEMEAELGGDIEPSAALGRAFAAIYAEYLNSSGETATFILPISGGNKSPETTLKYQALVAQDDMKLVSAREIEAANIATQAGYDRLDFETEIQNSKPALPPGVVARKLGSGCMNGATVREYVLSPVLSRA